MSVIETVREEAFASLRCFRCGGLVQRVPDCKSACVVEVVLFLGPEESTNLRLVFVGKVKISLRKDNQVLVMFVTFRVKGNVVASDMLVARELSDVFPEDISDLPPKHEVEFSIDLVPCIRPLFYGSM